jgi:biopolymer transport protein ExbB/TolQ
MSELMRQGGVMMWPILLITLVIAGIALWALLRIRKVKDPDAVLETGIDAVLFWGVWVIVVGLLGTFGGIYQAAGMIEQAGTLNPAIVWGGIKVALTTTLFGLLVFAVAAVVWLGLRLGYRRRVAA